MSDVLRSGGVTKRGCALTRGGDDEVLSHVELEAILKYLQYRHLGCMPVTIHIHISETFQGHIFFKHYLLLAVYKTYIYQ